MRGLVIERNWCLEIDDKEGEGRGGDRCVGVVNHILVLARPKCLLCVAV